MILDKHTWGMLNMRPRPYKREYGKQTQYNLHSGVAVLVRPYEQSTALEPGRGCLSRKA